MEIEEMEPIAEKKQGVNNAQFDWQLTIDCSDLWHPTNFGRLNAQKINLQTNPKYLKEIVNATHRVRMDKY